MNFRDVEYKGHVLTEGEIIRLFYFKFSEIPLLSRMEAVGRKYFIDQVETLRGRDLSEEEREELEIKFQHVWGQGFLRTVQPLP